MAFCVTCNRLLRCAFEYEAKENFIAWDIPLSI